MSRPRSAQELVHWLEVGAGARLIKLAATLAGVIALSWLVAWKQFHGATSEATLLQADVGRQLVRGEGYTTLVNFPQTAAVLAARGQRFDGARAYPELHQPPLYPLVIAGALKLVPAARREALWSTPPTPASQPLAARVRPSSTATSALHQRRNAATASTSASAVPLIATVACHTGVDSSSASAASQPTRGSKSFRPRS